jgi:predicted lipid-binding transport protein (Tim44 family)
MPTPIHQFNSWLSVVHWSFWIYHLSLGLLLFNILPIYPLDGGQMLQAALWKPLGYYKSMNFACITGMVGGVLIMAAGLATFAFGGLILMFIGFFGFLNCLQMRRALLAAGPEEYSDTTDYSAAYETFRPKRSRFSRWAAKRAMKLAKAERDERERIDQILAKVSAHGMHSLTWSEKRALRKATEHQRKRDMELGRTGRG